MKCPFWKKYPLFLRATYRFGLGIFRNGLEETIQKTDEISEQADFWFPVCIELAEELERATLKRDAIAIMRLELQLKLALRRFDEEVTRPLDNLHKVK